MKLLEVKESQAYYYRSYSLPEENSSVTRAPIYFKIVTLAFAHQYNNFIHKNQSIFNFLFKLPTLPAGNYNLNLSGNVTLHSYHVGQGMCSLMHNGSEGFLIDCGAGTPIKQPGYKSLKNNQLIVDLNNLQNVSMILSHFDSDHHRLLSWDSNILGKITNLYVPGNVTAGIIKDVNIHRIIRPCISITINLDNGKLHAYRTNPHAYITKKNNNALISVINCNNKMYLLPGDYIYTMVAKDKNPQIKKLAGKSYAYVVVPHHGDKHSTNGIFAPIDDSAIAYFSAGDNQGYLHPCPNSIKAHKNLKYQTVADSTNDQIDCSVTFNF
ncbi:hypothetical protein [Pantoea agglomerans]|uniref:hypothetical protein n=1 Tax=Enterobacter agglomerans TaxID=549 RepID=UPI001654C001|nr:hypothetical protein [Pantoea agglomerans]